MSGHLDHEPPTETFALTIDLGNAAMQSREDVAAALRGVAEKLEGGRSGGHVRDENGNTVGDFDWHD